MSINFLGDRAYIILPEFSRLVPMQKLLVNITDLLQGDFSPKDAIAP
ncbi:hypothetical protein H6G81_20930 [Scytonema hofmannii FACHB-248]|uniref:Uncharacterized protein n=1 Tax=Scytonema hofmannii FACHB-248 TaxID=1842502 RepID=A0ABR8GUJ1_9CYAN|nr:MULTISPECIES: hypothetical protein [Nostocales]MBD2606929.1 hypothetical protein [Scytonema hofmannii FACHB-248]